MDLSTDVTDSWLRSNVDVLYGETGVAPVSNVHHRYRCLNSPWWGRLRGAELAISLYRGYIEPGTVWRNEETGDEYVVCGELMETQRLAEYCSTSEVA